MTRTLLIILFLTALAFPSAAAEADSSPPPLVADPPLAGRVLGATAVDTTLLVGPWGSGAQVNGQFHNPTNQAPDFNGWTRVDFTDVENHWHASTYQAVTGTYSAWCGDPDIPSCEPGDPVGGYGNYWSDVLAWQMPVVDSGLPTVMRLEAVANVGVENAYDYVQLWQITATGELLVWDITGEHTDVVIDVFMPYEIDEYLGTAGDEVRFEFRVITDGAWSDADCNYPSSGAIQLDDVVVTMDPGPQFNYDFEDGTLGDFVPVQAPRVGNFAGVYKLLRDIDPCRANPTAQVAFIDDGVVEPGTGGTDCIDWCYLSNNKVVNPDGGLAGPGYYLHNAVVSPPLDLPTGDDGILLELDAYLHHEFTFASCPDPECLTNIVPWIALRSVDTGDPDDLEYAYWRPTTTIAQAGPGYERLRREFSDELVAGATHCQLALGLMDLDIVFQAGMGSNATPAPFYDNVRLTSFLRAGPEMSAYASELARDAFPAIGDLDEGNLGANSVRFDMVADPEWFEGKSGFIAGDSVIVSIVPRDGADVTGTPRMHYRLFRNGTFDAFRTAGLPDEGSVDLTLRGSNRWSVDLPDTGFLFPGDRLHYYFTAEDDLGGDVRPSILPADTTDFDCGSCDYGLFERGYDPAYVVRALPSYTQVSQNPVVFDQPQLLFWHDSGRHDDWDEWLTALTARYGVARGIDYDIFDGKSQDQVGRPLSRTATDLSLDDYSMLIYAGGTEHTSLGTDRDLLDAWVGAGGKSVFMSGNRVAEDIGLAPPGWMGLNVVSDDVRSAIGGQLAARVQAEEPSSPIWFNTVGWLAYGECDEMANASAIIDVGAGERAGQYLDPQGNPDVYPFAAMVVYDDYPATITRTVTLPWDFALVHTDTDEGAKVDASHEARARMLFDILLYFGLGGHPHLVSDVPAATGFAVANQPNPFNPQTTIAYSIERPGRLRLAIYDLRGVHVRTLVNDRVETNGAVVWDGTDAGGADVAAGVYLYEARMHGEVKTGKLAVVK